MAGNNVPSHEIPEWARRRRATITPAVVIKWNDTDAFVICPFPTCKKLHRHGSRRAPNGYPNSRLSHCSKLQQEYQLVWPYEKGSIAEDLGLGFELDRDAGVWRTVGSDIEDLAAEQTFEPPNFRDGEQTSEENLLASMDHLTLHTSDHARFISHCVCGEVAQATEYLASTISKQQLLERKDANGNTALALACMAGHLQMVTVLVKQGSDIDSKNKRGETPLIKSLQSGQIKVARFLVSQGASISGRDGQGHSVLSHTKQLLEELEEGRISALAPAFAKPSTPPTPELKTSKNKDGKVVMSFYDDPSPSPAMLNQMHQEKIDDAQSILNLCIAHEETQKRIKAYKLRRLRQARSSRVSISASAADAMVTVFRDAYCVPMADERKTFAFLELGDAHDVVFAVSGWSERKFGAMDGCLERELWQGRVFAFSRLVGHTLRRHERDGVAREGSFYASHAEMQIMAFVLWHFTALQEKPGRRASKEEEERYARVGELHQCAPHSEGCRERCDVHCGKRGGQQCEKYSGPPVEMIKPIIRVTRSVCDECLGFQRRILEYTGINIVLMTVT